MMKTQWLFLALVTVLLIPLVGATAAGQVTGNSLEGHVTFSSDIALAGPGSIDITGQASSFQFSTTSSSTTSSGTTMRVSVASDGTQANAGSGRASISADGRYVAFNSGASNLVPGDTNGYGDVFVHDRQTGQTDRVSVASDGTQGDANSGGASISANGRYVAFNSGASNLVPGDTNGERDVFVHDRQTGQTDRVSVASDGTQANDMSLHPSISADGRYVAFNSGASNLVPGDTNDRSDIFVHDRETGETSRVSVASDGTQANSSSWISSISADGRYVAFESTATNLVPGDTLSTWDIFVHDRQTGETRRVSVASDGTQGNATSGSPSISTDGRHVVFYSSSSNLVPGDTNDVRDVFTHDCQTGQTSRVSVASDGTQGNNISGHDLGLSISADGRYVTFASDATNLVPGDTNSVRDIFVHDRQTGETSRVSVASGGTQGNNGSAWPSISADGRYVAFASEASNLVPGDTNGAWDVFVHDRSGSAAFAISGNIADTNNDPIPGVTVSTHAGHGATTNANGDYTITGLITGTYTITPNNIGYTFSPTSRTVTVPPNATGQDFTGTPAAGDQPPIILLPGIMGSRLTNTPGTNPPRCILRPSGEIWPGLTYIGSGYNDRVKSLQLKLNEDETGVVPADSCDNITATGVFTKFFVGIPGVDADYYETFIAEMMDQGYQVYAFAYDWRLDLEQIAQALDSYLINTVGAPKVILVGHSLGGLVARQYTANITRAQKVEKVISVGTPYWGAPLTAMHMRRGTIPVDELNYLLFNPDVRDFHRNSPAVMQILPSPAYFQQATPYYVNNHTWFNSYTATTNFFKNNGQNSSLLDQAQSRHNNIDNFNNALHVPYYVLTANHSRVVAAVREFDCWLGTAKCWEEYLYARGDGTVPWVSARLSGLAGDWSGAAEVCTFTTGAVTKEHSQLLADSNVIADVKRIIQGQAPQYCAGASALATLTSEPDSLIQVALWGAARVIVTDSQGRSVYLNADRLLINEIPMASYQAAEDSVFITLPASDTYTLILAQENDMPLQLRISDFQAESVEDLYEAQARAVFINVPTAAGGLASLFLDPSANLSTLQLAVDLNNNGIPDHTLPPSAVLDAAESQDITMPVTTIAVQGSAGPLAFYTGPVTVSLAADDVGSGVYRTEYSLDGGLNWEVYTGPVTFVAEVVPLFYARSVDRAGNQEYPWPQERLQPYTLYLPATQR
jgi:Tol biopolymer transport system component/pimeloyl-ACP methyl ester carboxylesterase